MRATTAALTRLGPITGLTADTMASGETLRASLHPDRRDAPAPWWFRRRHHVRSQLRHGIAVFEIVPRFRRRPIELVYLHGGSYVNPLMLAHWLILDALVARTGARVTVPCYLLAPEHTAAESLPAVAAVVDERRAAGLPVLTVGDSAGAGMALAEAMRVRDSGGAPLAGAVLLSPFLDATMASPLARDLERLDPMLRHGGLVESGLWWAGDWGPDDWRVSPLRGELAELPPVTVLQGGRDVFLPDAIELVQRARDAGVDCSLGLAPEGFHVYVGARWTREAREGFDLVARRVLEAAY
ncbi:MAG: alpha/beta hydrolase fold domain-containing protein [Cellulomonadaceae bacterium]